MNKADIFGTIAAVCTTAAFLPQVVKIYRSGHARDLSLPMYAIFSFGVVCWAVYGVLTSSIPVILANSITLFLSLYILFMKIKYGD